jgi:hypothetical protein
MRKQLSITETQYNELNKVKVFGKFDARGTVVGIMRIPVVISVTKSEVNFIHYVIVEYPDAKA